jgi:SNF2 family DNA or RNA helicase
MNTCLLTLILRLRQVNFIIFWVNFKQACCSPKMVIDSMKRLQQKDDSWNGKEEESDESDDEFGVQDLKNAITRLQFYTNEKNKLEFQECTICLDNDATHSAVPCGHTLCHGCWEKLGKSQNNDGLKCPLCRRSVQQYDTVEQSLAALNNILQLKEIDEAAEENMLKCFSEENSSKIQKILEILDSEPNESFLIASQWTKALDNLEVALIKHNPNNKYVRIDGKVTPTKRFEIINKFQDPSNNIRICLVSLSASSEGVTMTRATRIIHLDPWWNDAKEYQMSNRVHRIGQSGKEGP